MTNYLIKRNLSNYDLLNAFDSFFAPTEMTSTMRTDVKQTEKEYLLQIDLAGFEKEEINLSFDKGILTVSAQKKTTEEKDDGYIVRERSSKVSRRYNLGDVNQDAITAKFTNGLLEICVPKKEVPTPRAIAID